MPVFVTGGTGFLGVNLVRRLVAEGHQCRLLVRSTSPRVGLDSELIEFVQGDITDRQSIVGAMAGCDVVFHLAAWVQLSPWGWREARRVNVEGTAHVADAALTHGVRRFIHTSSIATMGVAPDGAEADELTPWNLADRRIPYYQTKFEAEEIVREAVARGLNAVILNPTYVVGPWDIKPSAGRMIIHAVSGRPLVIPNRGGMNFVDVREVAKAHIDTIQRGAVGQRYILGGENLDFGQYFDRIATMSNVHPPRVTLPYAAAWPIAATGSLIGRIFPKAFRDINLCVLRSGYSEHYVSSARAVAELGFEAKPIDDAIRSAIEWFVDHGYLNASAIRAMNTARRKNPLANASPQSNC